LTTWRLVISFIILGVSIYGNTFDTIWGEVSKYETSTVVKNKHEHSKYGIRENTLNEFNKEYGVSWTVDELTYVQAKLIAENEFYFKYNINAINDVSLQLMVFDWVYNAGPTEAIKHLQRVANDYIYQLRKEGYTMEYLVVDGVLGGYTIRVLNLLSNPKLVHDYKIIRILTYRNKPRFKLYGKGWVYRINKLAI